MSKYLAVVSGAWYGAAGVDDVEEHVGGVLVVRAPWGNIYILPLGGTPQHCLRRRRGYGGVVFEGKLATSMFYVPRFPLIVALPARLRIATLTSPAWLHADDARSSFSSSQASWAASRCLESPPLVNAISHGSRSIMSPLSTNANLCRVLIRPSGKWNRAGMRYHI